MYKRGALLLLAVLGLTGCATVRIGRILDDPAHFRNRSVKVEGRVDQSFGALVAGVYQVDDGTGKIYVLSSGGGVPRSGARVSVHGTVVSGVTLGSRSYGTALREQSHKTHY